MDKQACKPHWVSYSASAGEVSDAGGLCYDHLARLLLDSEAGAWLQGLAAAPSAASLLQRDVIFFAVVGVVLVVFALVIAFEALFRKLRGTKVQEFSSIPGEAPARGDYERGLYSEELTP
ncbi:unnamed protein product [Amoebophrya sp. A25]|nr:unnamed protein product [Amoebophrya sp. A25]|eukprot:GSA25T00018071001.1